MEFTRESFDYLLQRNLELEQLISEKKKYAQVSRLNESQRISLIGSWSWDLLTNKIEWSEMMYTLLGLETNEEIPSYELALRHVHVEDKDIYERTLGQAVSTKGKYYLENRVVKKDRTTIHVISRGLCICNEEGEIIRMLGTVQDVTLVMQLLRTNKQLEQFANILSHDFKNPLQTIISFIELLKKKSFDRLTEKEKLYVSFIESGAQKLAELVNDILEYSSLSSPNLKITKIFMNEFMKSVLSDLMVILEKKDTEITIGEMPDYILADRVKLRRVFQNLVSNSNKYTEPHKNPKIEIYAEEDENQYVFYIKDNGMGISKEFIDKIFEPYTRVHNEESFSGIGIGLSICKGIIELHNGKIGCYSSNEEGTCMYFSIPKNQNYTPPST